jgi:hypothetical protein
MLRAVFERSRSRGADRLVLLAIADRADRCGNAWPGIEDIARRAALHRATVCRSVARLESLLGELDVKPGGGRRRPNRYRVLPRETVTSCDPLAAEKWSHQSVKGSHPRVETVARCDTNHQEPSGTIRNHQEPSKEPSFADARDVHRRLVVHRQARRTNLRSPDFRVAEWLERFCAAHEQTLGTKYLVRGARDGAHLKAALGIYDEATMQRALAEYFTDPNTRRTYGASVPQFVAHIGTLASRRGCLEPRRLAPVGRTPTEPMRLGDVLTAIATGTARKGS